MVASLPLYRDYTNSRSKVDLDSIYKLPCPLRTLEEFQRGRHEDLPYLDDAALDRDLRLVQLRADADTDPAVRAWLLERLSAGDVEKESRKRQRAQDAVPATAIVWSTASSPATRHDAPLPQSHHQRPSPRTPKSQPTQPSNRRTVVLPENGGRREN